MRGRRSGALAGACAACLLLACATTPPGQPDDICAIFRERPGWLRAAEAARVKWGVPESVQLAIIRRESSFRADARPPRSRWLGVLPGPRPSSAYGYGQVLDGTWQAYRRATGRRGADRDDFGDVTDFIGWYAQQARERAGIEPADARALYLAYQVGIGGYLRGVHRQRAAIGRRARQVEARSRSYAAQLAACADDLPRSRWWPW